MNSRSKHSESSHAAVMLQVMKKIAVSPMVAFVVLFALATLSLALDQVAAKATQNASQASDPQVGNGGEVNEGILPVPNYSGDLWSRSYLSGNWPDRAVKGDVTTLYAVSEGIKNQSGSCIPLCKQIIQMAEDLDLDSIQKLAEALDAC